MPVAQVARIAALSRVNVDYILTGDRKGTVFREIYVVDETIIASILRALNVTGVLGRLKDASEEQAALVLARRIARAYNEIENFAQDLASSHKVPIEEARATALSSFKGLFRAFESVTPDGD